MLEDDPLDAELEFSRLEEAGFRCDVIRVETQEDFLKMLDQGGFNLILADYNLPAFDGLSALALFVERNLNIPFILVSGTLGEETAIESLKAGATDYVLKERLSRLGLVVKRALREVEEQRQRKYAEQRVQRLLQQQLAANQLALTLGEFRNLDDIFPAIYEHVRQLMDVDTFIISFFETKKQLLYAGFVIAEGVVQDVAQFPPIPLEAEGQGMQSQVIRSGSSLYIRDVRQAMENTATKYTVTENGKITEGPPPDADNDEWTKSALFVPMKDRGETIGVMQVQSFRLDGYSQDDLDILAAMANVASIAIQNARLFDDAQRQLQKLQTLHNIDVAISASIDLKVTLNILLEQITLQLNVDAADVLLLPLESNFLEFTAGRGFRATGIKSINYRLGQGFAGRVALERKPLHMVELSTSGEIDPLLQNEDFASYYGIPLVAKGQMKGVLEIFHRSPLELEQEWLNFLDALATQAAIAIDNATLFRDLQRSNLELVLAYDTTLEGWAKALELRDMETEGHGRRVTELAVRMARALGISEEEITHVRRGALLHDIGKMGIPDRILQKPGPLDEQEMQIMRQHVTYAHEWLSPISFLAKALDIPMYHHERWDGTGYPHGLKGERIPLAARIFAIIDVWDALTSDRPYRAAWSEDEALQYIREGAGSHFDPEIVELFTRMIDDTNSG